MEFDCTDHFSIAVHRVKYASKHFMFSYMGDENAPAEPKIFEHSLTKLTSLPKQQIIKRLIIKNKPLGCVQTYFNG